MDGQQKQLLQKRNTELEKQLAEKSSELKQKNKELEIEASLERVRIVAMSMKHPADMLEVCKIIAHQLESLHVKEIRNVQTAIFYETKGSYTNYEFYAKHDKVFITEVDYKNHPLAEEFAYQMLKGPNEIFIRGFKGSEVTDWLNYQKTANVFIDPDLEIAGSLDYYWYSLGPVALSISTYAPLNEEEINLFKRFRNVFELAYRRYLDIEEAEAQARESQIQLALERVRARTMAMQKSVELQEVANNIYDRLHELKIEMDFANLISFIEGSKDYYVWVGGLSEPVRIPFNDFTQVQRDYNAAIERRDELFTHTFSGEMRNEYYQFLLEQTALAKSLPDQQKKHLLEAEFNTASLAFTKNTCIQLVRLSDKAFSKEENEILKRFVKVFEQAYVRFLDLQKAEIQAREAQIEAALEKVRSRSLAMHKSDELQEVVHTVFEKLKELNVDLYTAIIFIFAEGSKDIVWWLENKANQQYSRILVPYADNPYLKDIFDAKENGKDFFSGTYSFEEKNELFHHLFEHTDFKYVPEKQKQFLLESELAAMSVALAKNTGINITSYSRKSFSENENEILKRFAKVFEQAYTRFLDLQKAEAQAREAQIEAALEKVRSRTMAMHKSEELIEVIASVFQQLEQLSFRIDSANLFLNYKENPFKFWMAVPGHLYPSEIDVPYGDFALMNRFIREIKSDATLVTAKFNQEEKNEWVRHLIQHTIVGNSSDEKKKHMFEAPGLAMSVAGVKNIALAITNYSVQSYSDEENEILKRFVIVFGQTYTRFLDLQKAEAQAREAQIEAALERVRSRTTGMQKSEELREVIQMVFEQLQHLDFNIDSAHFNLNYKESDDYTLWSAAPGQPYPVKTYIPYFDHPVFITARQAKEKGLDFFTESYTQDEKNNFFEHLFKHTPVIPEERRKYILSGRGIAASAVLMNTISLWIMNYAGIPYSEAENAILKRFGKIFEQSHTRFLDLQKAEAQARETQISLALERVRARTMAMQQSNELAETAAVLFQQFKELGEKPIQITIGIMNEEQRVLELQVTDWDGSGEKINRLFNVSIDEPTVGRKVHTAWKGNRKSLVVDLPGKELEDWINYRNKISGVPDNFVQKDRRRVISFGFFSKGAVSISSAEPRPEDTIRILERFANVFDLTYTRFLDLKKAENQAREAQIEASLERVRSRSMSMQKSGELKEVIQVVYDQFVRLNINIEHTGFVVDYKAKGDWHFWIADRHGVPSQVTVPYFDSVWGKSFNEAKEKGEDFFATNLNFEEKNKFYQDLLKHIPRLPEEAKEFYFSCIGLAVSTVLLENVSLYIENFSGISYSDEDNATLIRFGKVFQQTYTRFLDLQKAEVQALEAIKRASVDRVRAEIASMRTTNDLERITPLMWNELTTLGVPFIRCGVFIMDDEQQQIETHLSTPDGESIAAFKLPYNAPGETAEILAHWYKKELYKQHWNEAQFVEFTQNLVQQGAITSGEKYLTESRPTDLYLHFLPFLQGMLYAGNTAPLSDDALQLMQNLADAFSTAYARYEDFNKLEAAKKQVDNALDKLQATQKQLIQSEKMASLGELTAGIAHEIQNPLNFVNNFSEVNAELITELEEEADKGNIDEIKSIAQNIKENEEKINHHGKRADAIVKSMLQHSRKSEGVKEPTDINALCDEYLRLSYHGLRAKDKSFNADFKPYFDESIGKINIIPQDIGRVLLNLFNNAFYAVNEKQKAENSKLKAQSEEYKPTVSVSTKNSGDKLEIKVADNGNGIPQNIVDKIFQPFFTTKPTGQGTGLGLSLTYDIIKTHGGEIKVESEYGKGSEFIIILQT